MKKLKVYGWRFFRREAKNTHKQTREIVAATSLVEAARLSGSGYSHRSLDMSETSNKREIEVAMAEPGVVFWRELDAWGDRMKWNRVQPPLGKVTTTLTRPPRNT